MPVEGERFCLSGNELANASPVVGCPKLGRRCRLFLHAFLAKVLEGVGGHTQVAVAKCALKDPSVRKSHLIHTISAAIASVYTTRNLPGFLDLPPTHTC